MSNTQPAVLHLSAVDFLRTLPDASVDAVVTDPPYAEVDRHYGRLTEREWRALMDGVVIDVRRVLTPTGSAVFILQPNSERVGRMRSWLFRWMADMADEWNMVQDAYWWNPAAMPTIHSNRDRGLAAWWVRYICPPGGLVVDPFAGSGTMGWAALDQGRRWLGADSDPQWANPDGATVPAQGLLWSTA